MSQDREMMSLMREVHERVIRIETKIEDLPDMKDKLEKHGEEILKQKTSLKLLQRIAFFLFVSVPATAVAIVKLVKGS